MVVGVVDTGARATHQELRGASTVSLAFDARGRAVDLGEGDAHDLVGHGTATCSLVAGTTLGVAPGARLVVARASPDAREAGVRPAFVRPRAVLAALDALAVGAFDRQGGRRGVDVVSLSLGWPAPAAWFEAALRVRARRLFEREGTLVVAAVGDADDTSRSGAGVLAFPAAFDFVVAVGAADGDGRAPLWSGRSRRATPGPAKPDLLAPGVDLAVASAAHDEAFGVASGSSFATALVAGAAALCLARDARLVGDASALRSRLLGLAPRRGRVDLGRL